VNLDAHHPGLPDRYTPEWEGQLVADMSFAPAAEVLLLNGRVEEARTLCEAGVVAHPFYATGHLLLGRAYLAESRWDDARLELERALQLDGSYPAILENLAACYEQLGLTDLAQGCHALGRDLDPRPLTRDEDEGGPEMVDDLDKRSEEGGEPEEESLEEVPGAVNLDDIGSPEDALKELEALLEGTDSSSESEEAKAEPVPEPVTEEVDLPAEEPEIEPAPEPAGAIDLDASLEGGEPPAGEEEDAEKAELWKKIMDQAEQAEGGDYQSMEDLEQIMLSSDEIEKVIAQHSAPFFRTSALAGEAVEDAFIEITKMSL